MAVGVVMSQVLFPVIVCVTSYFIILALVMTNARQTHSTRWQSVDTLPVTDWAFSVFNLKSHYQLEARHITLQIKRIHRLL